MEILDLIQPFVVANETIQVALGLEREDGEKPSRTRRRNRGRKLPYATVAHDGKAQPLG